MEIKKLSKEEKDEGLTLELINSIDMKKKASPVMFKKGDEPVRLVKCTPTNINSRRTFRN
jgi:hypothetical protein